MLRTRAASNLQRRWGGGRFGLPPLRLGGWGWSAPLLCFPVAPADAVAFGSLRCRPPSSYLLHSTTHLWNELFAPILPDPLDSVDVEDLEDIGPSASQTMQDMSAAHSGFGAVPSESRATSATTSSIVSGPSGVAGRYFNTPRGRLLQTLAAEAAQAQKERRWADPAPAPCPARAASPVARVLG